MKKTIISLVLLLALCFTFAGCGDLFHPTEPTEPVATVLVLGAHSNYPYFGSFSYLTDSIYESCYSYGSVTIIVADGEPYVAADFNVKKPKANVDKSKRKMLAEENAATIIKKLYSFAAKTPEVDTLSALTIAGDKLNASDCSVKKVILDDSCLSTTGLLNFASSQLLIEEDAESIVEQLVDRKSLPNLSGVNVEVIGLGQTSGDQTSLTPSLKAQLTEIWQAILSSSGATVTINTTPLKATTESEQSLPAVSTITVIKDSLTLTVPTYVEETSVEETTPTEETPVTPIETPVTPFIEEVVRFDETSVKFKSNTAELADKDKATAALKPIGEILKNNPDLTVYLAGMTASTGGDGKQLSLERAKTVKSLLLDMGAKEKQVSCVGLGRTENFLRVNDLDSDGNLMENKAKLNRAVFLFGSDSETAKKLGLN